MFGLFCKKQDDAPQYRIQSSGVSDRFVGYIIQKYVEGCTPSGYCSMYWTDIAKFKTLEEARVFLNQGERKTIY